ncbi:unnamed protein product [Parascedosporium putredinis]|uniref:Uncharacterized protein n=1 Tax=Parascedosporium putredinis TaxID=1442378 RepID=A0A9P1GYP0_9PEZI|nr:unnamed protein product [Parascedosporium putredinis]CAI7990931.1 unnamed protein product [Parascedosporium putredinis]
MRFDALLTAAAAALASGTAAHPSYSNPRGNCPPGVPVQVPLSTLTHVELTITGLQLTGVTVDIPDITPPSDTDVTCQMYKDEYGVQPGSAEFFKGHDAHISTNPVQFGWVLCYVNVHSN